ncbi:adenylate kinase 1 isoform X2 [Megachile rotundata]|uniref:adenylate kinase 1 isoform X2 n=1 Tax=Megachile rotundata TaxID=143995 RepID=UPI000614C7CB|nr:PREDICTED: adenylate kinase isoenzyme 1 isoform X2 [Megachile rotundata]
MSTIAPFLLFTSFIDIITDEGQSKVEDSCELERPNIFGTMKTIWVVGGPGCGKGTQCERIIAKYGFYHISSGDLLREEVASGSPRGSSLQELMSKGLFVPTDIVLDLIRERMEKAKNEGATKTGYLIDGYPRELDQGKLFEKNVCPVDMIIFFDVADETLMKRLLGRAAVSQRADDNEETIKKRIEIFNEKNGAIVEHYKDKVVRIVAEGSVDEIFAEVSKALDGLLA